MIAKGAGKPLILVSLPSFVSLPLFAYTDNFVFLLFLSLPLFTVIFFRDPKRTAADGIVSPADGKVVKVTGSSFDIFMSVTNVHVNRSPVSGEVVSMKHYPGKHRPAYKNDVSNNERLEILMKSEDGTVKVTQIAGIFARRIVPYISEGDSVERGQRIGMIRFGSRVRVELPEEASISASEGDVVRAGETTVGEWS
ncbi:MAG: phosphatidylserine decarboxylase [Thermoplasmata archaeon]